MIDKLLQTLRSKLINAGLEKIYIGDLPSLQLDCIAIRTPDGYASSRYFGLQVLNEPLVEVIVRNKDYATGQNWYMLTSDLFDQLVDTQNGILSCVLTGSPGYLGRDTEGFNEWHMLLHVTLKE